MPRHERYDRLIRVEWEGIHRKENDPVGKRDQQYEDHHPILTQSSHNLLSSYRSHLYNARVQSRYHHLATVLIPLLAFAARILPGPRTIDDAYITFRYAQNLISGHGLVYNPGELVLGTTTPLYATLLAGIGGLIGTTQAFPVIAFILNAAADAIACYLLIKLGRAIGASTPGIGAALVWAIAPMSVTFAIGGMETSFFIMLMLATFYFHSSHRPVLAAGTGALCLLTRPDALLFLLPILAERARCWIKREDSAPTLLEVGVFSVPILLWLIVGTSVYGNPIPNSIMAKSNAYVLPPEAGFVRLLQHFGTPFLGHLTFGNFWIGAGLILFTGFYALGGLTIFKRHHQSWPILVFPFLYFLAYAIANPLIFRWYLTPPLPTFILLIFIGAERLFEDLKVPVLKYAFIAIALVLTLRGWTLQPSHGLDRPAPEMAYIKLELLYKEAANILLERDLTDATIAAGDIGALGYYTKAQILDTIGLISPVSLKYYPLPESLYTINYAIPPDLILDLEPDYLVILEVYGRGGLLEHEDFLRSYRLITELPTNIYESDGMYLFERMSS